MGVKIRAKMNWDGIAPINFNDVELFQLVWSLLDADPRRFDIIVDGEIIPDQIIKVHDKLIGYFDGAAGEPITYGDLSTIEIVLRVTPMDDLLQTIRVKVEECLRSHRLDYQVEPLVETEIH